MTFQFQALDAAPFVPLFDLDEAQLAARNAARVPATKSDLPCRVSLTFAELGEELLLANHQHLKTGSPYDATHAVFVRRGAVRAEPEVGDVPLVLQRGTLSVRAFDEMGFMRGSAVIDHTALRETLETMFEASEVTHIDVHYAAAGCFAARCVRA